MVLFVQQAFRLIRSLAANTNTNMNIVVVFLRSIVSAGSSLNKALKFRMPLRRFVAEFIQLKKRKDYVTMTFVISCFDLQTNK